MNVLVVDDDPTLLAALLRLLACWGYATVGAASAHQARAWLAQEPFDLVLLDLGLPDGDGLALCRELRRRAGHQPLVLLLTALSDRPTELQGFNDGADDFMVKPFDPEVLRARLRALLRRAAWPLQAELGWGPLRLRPGDSEVRIGGQPLPLTRTEALLLEQLLRAAGASCSKTQLLQGCGEGRREAADEVIRTHMRNLRRKLGSAGCPPELIETVYGHGYRLNPATAA